MVTVEEISEIYKDEFPEYDNMEDLAVFLHNKIVQLTEDLDYYKRKADEWEDEADSLESRNDSLVLEMGDLEDRVEELENEIKGNENKLSLPEQYFKDQVGSILYAYRQGFPRAKLPDLKKYMVL